MKVKESSKIEFKESTAELKQALDTLSATQKELES